VSELVGRDPGTGELLRVETAGGIISRITRIGGPAGTPSDITWVGGPARAPSGAACGDAVIINGAAGASGYARFEDAAFEDAPWIAPGLIDLQVNGYQGFDVNEPELRQQTVAGLVLALRRVGVTTVVPTLITAPADQLLASLATIARARRASGDRPCRDRASEDRACGNAASGDFSSGGLAHAIPFVHVEGPFLSDQDGPRGVHDARHIRPPDVAEVRAWQRASDGLVGMVTISPHWPGSAEFIRAATGLGIRVAIGHTHATSEQVHEAVAAGATVSTHLGNGAHATLPRHPNYLWAQLADDNLRVGLIADGHHLPADTFKAMVRAVGLDRAHLVSDATSLAGMAPGRYRTPLGDTVDLSPDGRLSHVGTPYLAGAARGLHECAALATELGDLSLDAALALATRNPARLLPPGEPPRGVLAVSAAADLITFDFTPGDQLLRATTVLTDGRGSSHSPW